MPIRAEYDPEARAMYVRLSEGRVGSSVEDGDFVVDLDADSEVVGIEIPFLPVTNHQLASLALRFGFVDRLTDIWNEVNRTQPPAPSRSGVGVYYAVEFKSDAPLAVGASSATIELESHEYALAR